MNAMVLSRRTFLIGLAGGLAAGAGGWGLWQVVRPSGAAGGATVPPCCDYVDYAGWILTKADKERLTDPGTLTRLDGTALEGRTLTDQVVPDVESCAVWCLGEPDCQGFTFGLPAHPDPREQKRCTLKETSELRRVPNPMFSSGVR